MTTLHLQDIGLRPAQLKAVEKKARRVGTSPQQYVRQLIERDLEAPSLAAILGPIREDFKKNGVTPDQLEQIVRRARVTTRPVRGKAQRTSRP
jgi:hypothetical protein